MTNSTASGPSAVLVKQSLHRQSTTPRLRPGGVVALVIITTALLLTVFEGAIRKWHLNGELGMASYAAYLSKDFIFAALLLCPKYKWSQGRPGPRPLGIFLIGGALLIVTGAGLSCLQGVSPVGAALDLRSMLVLPAIAYLAVRRLTAPARTAVLWVAAAATLVNCGLAVVQTRLPPDHILNQYALTGVYIVELPTGVRAAGTFAFITGLEVMSNVGVFAGLGLLSLATTIRAKMAGWITIAAAVGCGLASVSRAPLLIDVVIMGVWVLFARLSVQRMLAVAVAALAVLIYAAAAGLLPTAQRLSDALAERSENVEDSLFQRAFGQNEEAITAATLAPLGNGFGFEQVGGNFFSTGNFAFANFEGQFPRVIMDTTVFGFAGYIVICGGALWALQRAKRGASRSDRAFLLATQLFLASIFYGSEVYNHTASSFAWIVFAIAFTHLPENLSDPGRPIRATRAGNVVPPLIS